MGGLHARRGASAQRLHARLGTRWRPLDRPQRRWSVDLRQLAGRRHTSGSTTGFATGAVTWAGCSRCRERGARLHDGAGARRRKRRHDQRRRRLGLRGVGARRRRRELRARHGDGALKVQICEREPLTPRRAARRRRVWMVLARPTSAPTARRSTSLLATVTPWRCSTATRARARSRGPGATAIFEHVGIGACLRMVSDGPHGIAESLDGTSVYFRRSPTTPSRRSRDTRPPGRSPTRAA